jgi:hypothetical protein
LIVPKANRTTSNLSVSGSASADSADTGDCAIDSTEDSESNEYTDSITVDEFDADNTIVLYYIDSKSHTADWEAYNGKCGDTAYGASPTVTLTKSGNTLTLKLIADASATRGNASVTASATAVVHVITFPDGQMAVESPRLYLYGV